MHRIIYIAILPSNSPRVNNYAYVGLVAVIAKILGRRVCSVGIAASTFAGKMYLQVQELFILTACFSRKSKIHAMHVQIVISKYPSRKIIYEGRSVGGSDCGGKKARLDLPPFPVQISTRCTLVNATKTHTIHCSILICLEVLRYCHPLFFPRHETQYMHNTSTAFSYSRGRTEMRSAQLNT